MCNFIPEVASECDSPDVSDISCIYMYDINAKGNKLKHSNFSVKVHLCW